MCPAYLPTQTFVPPRYTIDLSLPPRQRYKTLAAEYKTQLQALTVLYDRLLLDMAVPSSLLTAINVVSRVLLRRVHNSEQTKELRGIADETSIPMYLLVAFNVVLDLLMGCTSGAVRCLETGEPYTHAKMLHFRTLDWTMDPLRQIVVQLDFVRSKAPLPMKILASSVTYVGFTGVLTGVQKGLSISLNFRAVHNASTRSAHVRFYLHHVLVLLGLRPSIGSLLRGYLFKDAETDAKRWNPAQVAADLQSRHTTAAYVILSDGRNTMTMEKDFSSAKIKASPSFIAITNHDKDEHEGSEMPNLIADAVRVESGRKPTGLEDLIEESTDRLDCIQKKWDAKLRRAERATRRSNRQGHQTVADAAETASVTQRELVKWLCDWPTTNECTHYATVLDPSLGIVTWSRAYLQSPKDPNSSI